LPSFAETNSLLGDAFTWVGLVKEKSAVILATALILRVTAFIIFSPFAGVLADRMSRKIFYTLPTLFGWPRCLFIFGKPGMANLYLYIVTI
jgi:hypothetical protein